MDDCSNLILDNRYVAKKEIMFTTSTYEIHECKPL